MSSLGFINNVPLGDTLPLPLVVRTTSDVPVDADATPTFTIHSPDDGTALLTGSLSIRPTGLTGVYMGSVICSSANGFASGQAYTGTVSYAVSGSARADEFTFFVK